MCLEMLKLVHLQEGERALLHRRDVLSSCILFYCSCLKLSNLWCKASLCSLLAASSQMEEPWGWLEQPPASEVLPQSGLAGNSHGGDRDEM